MGSWRGGIVEEFLLGQVWLVFGQPVRAKRSPKARSTVWGHVSNPIAGKLLAGVFPGTPAAVFAMPKPALQLL